MNFLRALKEKLQKKEPHCGGCMINCPLAAPRCLTGQDRARRWQEKQNRKR